MLRRNFIKKSVFSLPFLASIPTIGLGSSSLKNTIKEEKKEITPGKVTYDFERLMDNATLLSCSDFAQEIVNNM